MLILLWVILRLPALQLFEAEETHGNVWTVFWRSVDEASSSHLEEKTNEQNNFSLINDIFTDVQR